MEKVSFTCQMEECLSACLVMTHCVARAQCSTVTELRQALFVDAISMVCSFPVHGRQMAKLFFTVLGNGLYAAFATEYHMVRAFSRDKL